MGDGDATPFRSSVVANYSAPMTAASQTRRSKQFGFKPTRGHTYSSTSISINSGKNGLARSLPMHAVRSLLLCSDATSFVTGQTFVADGGQTIRGLAPLGSISGNAGLEGRRS
jgi:hypothetical protein